jgi:release factor glutamine methyltransferase
MDHRAHDLIRHCAERLKGHGIQDPEKESELIVTGCAGIDRLKLYRDDPPIEQEAVAEIDAMLERRLRREPLAYILGHADFYGLDIAVGPGVLVPRPETELIVTEVLRRVKRPGAGLKVLDLCTGSGCLALAIAKELPGASVLGADVSGEALAYAKQSSRANGIENATFIKGHLFEPVGGMSFDYIVSNPPYVKRGEIDGLMPEVRDWEPREALDGGDEGLDFYRAILREAPSYLRPGGLILLELGMGQATDVARVARASGLETVGTVKDYCDIERVMVLKAAVD